MRLPPVWMPVISSAMAWIALLSSPFVSATRANVPGGGTGTGANVTMTVSSTYVTMDNGIVHAVIRINTGQLTNLTYNGEQFTDGYYASANGCFYWQGTTGSSGTAVVVQDPATNGGNMAEVSIEDPAANSGNGANAHRHFTLLRGAQGIYVTEIFTRDASFAAGGVDVVSFTGKLEGTSLLDWLAQDGADPRNLAMPTTTDLANATSGVNAAPKEVTLLTTGKLTGQFDCKYNYAGDLGSLTTTGWCSTSGAAGIWIIHPSNEYFTCGPMHREILSQMHIVQTTFKGVHFGFNDDSNFAAGETWSRVCGPFFIYVNKAAGNNPPQTMFADAQAQAQAERSAWPYTWFSDGNYAPASGRGTVTGKIVINDAFSPNASSAGLWVGVEQQPSSPTTPLPTDFQLWGKNYQYWVKTDSAGNFTIPNVVAGSNYTLFAFGPGAIGQFQSQALSGAVTPIKIDYPATQFAVAVTGGQTTALGTLTWTPARTGPTVFEIGVPDRDTQEFRHGDDYWHGTIGTADAPAYDWAPFQFFPREWPNGLNYTVGQSHWAVDWDYAQPTILDSAGNYDGDSWTITFNLPNPPTAGASAFLYLGIADDTSGPVVVSVNNTNLGSTSGVTAVPSSISSTGFFTAYDNDAMIRMSSHGIFCDERLTFPASLLKAGTNTVTLNMRKGGYFANAASYDYVRLELPGYVPPPPAGLTALAGKAVVQLRWPAAPGATSYNILRSTTPGSGYVMAASGITGPVAGSTPDTASYTDPVANGVPYYYVVQSANTAGASGSSAQASAAPSVSAPGAPTAPTGVTAMPGDMQVTLVWTAAANADYYIIKRSLNSGGPYTVISDTATTNTYTDLGRSNGMTYFYVVEAANAGGISTDSNEASALASQTVLLATPANLLAASTPGSVNLSWSAVAGATGYIVQRATVASGPYTILSASQSGTAYTDATAAGNITYYYEVAASGSNGSSAFTSPVSILTPPAAPTNLTAVRGDMQVRLNWSAPAGATSYNVLRATVSGGPYTTLAAGLTATTYTDTGLTDGTTYYYVVSASDAPGGTGGYSTEASVTPTIGAPVVADAGNLSATVGTSFSYQISATNSPASFSASGLPEGLTVDPSSGLISGTPTAAGFYQVTLGATNAGGTGNAAASLLVNPALPSISATALVPQVTAGSGDYAEFELSRSGDDLSTQLLVAYTLKGTAVNGTDYVLLKGVKKMKPGKASVKIKVVPLGDGGGDGAKKTVVLRLAAGDGYTATGNKAKVKIIGE